jgi:hypothetical protein
VSWTYTHIGHQPESLTRPSEQQTTNSFQAIQLAFRHSVHTVHILPLTCESYFEPERFVLNEKFQTTSGEEVSISPFLAKAIIASLPYTMMAEQQDEEQHHQQHQQQQQEYACPSYQYNTDVVTDPPRDHAHLQDGHDEFQQHSGLEQQAHDEHQVKRRRTDVTFCSSPSTAHREVAVTQQRHQPDLQHNLGNASVHMSPDVQATNNGRHQARAQIRGGSNGIGKNKLTLSQRYNLITRIEQGELSKSSAARLVGVSRQSIFTMMKVRRYISVAPLGP